MTKFIVVSVKYSSASTDLQVNLSFRSMIEWTDKEKIFTSVLFISSGGEKKEENVAAARPRVNLEGPAPRDNLPAGARRRRPGEAGLLLSKAICTRHHRLPGAGSNLVVGADQVSS